VTFSGCLVGSARNAAAPSALAAPASALAAPPSAPAPAPAPICVAGRSHAASPATATIAATRGAHFVLDDDGDGHDGDGDDGDGDDDDVLCGGTAC
jgi:hypothetical protein